MKLNRLLVFAVLLTAQAQIFGSTKDGVTRTEVWVSPTVDESSEANGDVNSPFASLNQALLFVRQLRAENTPEQLGEVHVILRGGTYRLSETLVIDGAVGGTVDSPTIIEAAEGETPVLSGGVPVGGWQTASAVSGLPDVAQGKVWAASTPLVGGQAVKFRQMWVNGVKMRRASTFDDLSMPQIVSVDKDNKTFTIPRPKMDLANAKHLEFYIPQDWEVNIMRVKSINPIDQYKSTLTLESEGDIEFKRPWPILRAENGSHSNHRFYLANAIELLNRPQEWFCDVDNNTIYYWPRSGETQEAIDAVVPHLETLLRIDGTLDNLTSNIQFRGIVFEHTTWMRPSEQGHVALQSGQYLYDAWSENTATANNVAWVGRPAAGVCVQNARNISFDGCRFRHMGSAALDFVGGTRNVTVNGCLFTDIAGNGICAGYFGDENFEVHQAYNPEDSRVTCDSIYITNNLIVEPGNEDWGCHGIGVGFASNVNVLHNEIVDAPYSAISVGWGWIHTENIMRDNHIDYNHINGFAVYLRDCGAIYTLSPQPNSTIHGNWIEKPGDSEICPLMWNMKTAQADIYADEGTDYYTITDNWCSQGILFKNQNGDHNTWANNDANVSNDIRMEAGLQDDYKYLIDEYAQPSYAPVDSIGDMTNADCDQIDFVAQDDGFKLGSVLAVDLNNDNLMDIVYGGGEGYQVHAGGVRMNTGNYGFAATQSLRHALYSNFAAGDLDGDGNIDLVQSGFDFWDAYNTVLMNDGKGRLAAHDIGRGASAAPACGIADINNDGLPDYFFVGNGKANAFYLQKAYRDGFSKSVRLTLPGGFSDPNMMYADFDNNQAVDICLLSKKTDGVYTRIHFNDGTGVFKEKEIGVKEKGTRGGMAYADVNGDGWLDIAIGGMLPNEDWSTTAANGGKVVSLYLNNGDGTFTLSQEFSEYMQDNVTCPIRFCDWDNDGYPDLILSGWNMTQGNISQVDVYLNDGKGHFEKSDVELPGVSESALELADFTGEGRNDILITGNANGAMHFHGYDVDRRLAVLCKNHTGMANTAPVAPSELSAVVDGNSVALTWNDGADKETPVKSLSYNYYIRNVDTGLYLTFPNADITTGKRRVSSMGNAWLNHGWTLHGLPKGNYAWSVQTVDAGYAGSPFAQEQTFTITQELVVEEELSIKEKMLRSGWTEVQSFDEVDCGSKFFAMLDESNGLTIVADESAGTKNWGNTLAMYYSENADPTADSTAVFVFDQFVVNDELRVILSSINDPNRHFRTEGWNHTLWQTYSDAHKQGDTYAVDGNKNIAMLVPEYNNDKGWAFRNVTSNAYIGPWDSGSFTDGAEFAADKPYNGGAHFRIYSIGRTAYLQQKDDWTAASIEKPLDVTRLITNHSLGRFDENRHPIGWNVEGEGQVEQQGKLSNCDYYVYMNYYQTTGKLSDRSVSQTLRNLPKGQYRLSVYSMCPGEGAYLFADDASASMTHTGLGTTNLDFSISEDTSLTLGVKLTDYQKNLMRFDNFNLLYLGDNINTGIDGFGLSSISGTADGPMEIYSLQGICLSSVPTNGVYIIRQGGKVRKMLGK